MPCSWSQAVRMGWMQRHRDAGSCPRPPGPELWSFSWGGLVPPGALPGATGLSHLVTKLHTSLVPCSLAPFPEAPLCAGRGAAMWRGAFFLEGTSLGGPASRTVGLACRAEAERPRWWRVACVEHAGPVTSAGGPAPAAHWSLGRRRRTGGAGPVVTEPSPLGPVSARLQLESY